MTDLRVAIAGYGLAGREFHAPLVAATDGLSVAFVVTRDAGRAAAVRREHPDAVVVASTDDLWERGGVDVLVVAAPNELHAPLALEAISRGVPVVVDKPMALNSAQAQELVDAAERAEVLLAPFHNRRWDSDQLTLRRLLADGRLGDVYRYESRFERWRPEARGGAWREDLPGSGAAVSCWTSGRTSSTRRWPSSVRCRRCTPRSTRGAGWRPTTTTSSFCDMLEARSAISTPPR